jgi:hypothetical protein
MWLYSRRNFMTWRKYSKLNYLISFFKTFIVHFYLSMYSTACCNNTELYFLIMCMFDVHRSVHRNIFLQENQPDAPVSQIIYFCITLYMFRTVCPSIIRSSGLYIQQQAYVEHILLPATSGNEMERSFSVAYTLYTYSYSQHRSIYSGLYSYSLGCVRKFLLLFLYWFPLNLIILKVTVTVTVFLISLWNFFSIV